MKQYLINSYNIIKLKYNIFKTNKGEGYGFRESFKLSRKINIHKVL